MRDKTMVMHTAHLSHSKQLTVVNSMWVFISSLVREGEEATI